MAGINEEMFGVIYGSDSDEDDDMPAIHIESSHLSDTELNQCTRLSRDLFNYILNEIRPQLERKTKRHQALSADTQLLIACTFFASGGFQWLVGRAGNISQSATSRIIYHVVDALLLLAPRFIRLPTTEAEQVRVKQGFYDIAGFPNTLAAVDGTHIYIKKPSVNPNSYVNRKGRHSVNVQVACDHTLRIVDVVANYPGSNHDSYIWANSSVREMLASGRIRDGWFIGDRGYPSEPWLMTEVDNPHTEADERYNAALRSTRSVAERCIGVLKVLFSCIDLKGGTLLYTPVKVCRIFVAVCVLHNLRIHFHLDLPEVAEPNAEQDMIQDILQQPINNGHEARAQLIINHF